MMRYRRLPVAFSRFSSPVARCLSPVLLALLVLLSPNAASAEDAKLYFLDASGNLLAGAGDLAVARTPPPGGADDEAFQVLVAGEGLLPQMVGLASRPAPESDARPRAIELLADQPLSSSPCPAFVEAGKNCARSGPVRLVFDDIDRRHPLLEKRSLLAELGGSVTAQAAGAQDRTVRVGSAFGRHRARLRMRLVRMLPGGPAPLGRDDAEAIALAREEIDRASGIWSVCGVSFGPSSKAEVSVVDPPAPFLLSIGCDAPVLAAGGEIRFLVDGHEVTVPTRAGATPREVARRVDAEIDKLGYRATVSDNRAPHSSSLGSSDVLVARKGGQLATLSAPKRGPLSSDAALDVCIGRVNLEDALQHFTDAEAIAGTLEERTLIKAFDDGDPTSLDVIVVPSFGGDARIGESFIFLEHGAIRNVVIEDRSGFRAQRASFTLAHEIGHVLLDQPGHPDDFGFDTPTSLMDADAVNGSAFGPRRLSSAECERAHRQSGSKSPVQALLPWPLVPLLPCTGPGCPAKKR